MSIIQASHRFPVPDEPLEPGWDERVDYMKARVRERFGLELIAALTERGGIVGPIHEDEARQKDWLWHSGMTEITFTIYAKLTEMPEPEHYRFMGGPADGKIQMTGGALTWRIPYMDYSAASAFDAKHDEVRYAEYEREGDTQVYTFRRIE